MIHFDRRTQRTRVPGADAVPLELRTQAKFAFTCPVWASKSAHVVLAAMGGIGPASGRVTGAIFFLHIIPSRSRAGTSVTRVGVAHRSAAPRLYTAPLRTLHR